MNKFKKLTRDQRKWRTAVIMLLPALVFLALLIAYPLGKVIHDAFYHVHLINKSMTGFAGMANFQKVLADELGVEPSPEIKELFHRIFNVKGNTTAESAAWNAPFLGRTAEI